MNLILQAIRSLFRKMESVISHKISMLSERINMVSATAETAQSTAETAQSTAENANAALPIFITTTASGGGMYNASIPSSWVIRYLEAGQLVYMFIDGKMYYPICKYGNAAMYFICFYVEGTAALRVRWTIVILDDYVVYPGQITSEL